MADISPPSAASRRGLLAAGNFIIDHVKMIDYFPAEENLATILSESKSGGGGPYNVLKDLAKMGAPFPLEAAGLIGQDAGAAWMLEDCAAHGIATSRMVRTADAPTSYTDAFTVASTGKRTFFHQPGANGLLAPEHIDLSGSGGRLFYLAYLMLLDRLDAVDDDGTTGAAQVLEAASRAGFRTIADVVSKNHPNFSKSVRASLPQVDVLVLNEIEAGRVTGRELRPAGNLDVREAREATRDLLKMGVRQWVVMHSMEGCIASSAQGETIGQPSLLVPQEFIKGATGAGDAFAAGLIWGLHEEQPMAQSLRLAVCAAAMCLSDPTTSGGMRSAEECLALGGKFGYRSEIQST